MIDELRQIAIFSKAIDHGSFRGAADDLRLAPSVVSHHISQLEEKLGVVLIYRSTRKLTLTQEGERLRNAAQLMQNAIGDALNDLRGLSDEPSGVLRVSMTAALSQSDLVGAITDYCALHPKIQVELDFTDTKRHFIDDRIDLAIRVGAMGTRSSNQRHLFAGTRILIAATSYLDAHPAIKTPEHLGNHTWIELGAARGAKPKLRKAGAAGIEIAPSGQISVNDAFSLYQFAKSGAGLAIVPEFLARADITAGHVQIVLPEWGFDPMQVLAEWPSNAPKNGNAARLVEYLAAYCQKQMI